MLDTIDSFIALSQGEKLYSLYFTLLVACSEGRAGHRYRVDLSYLLTFWRNMAPYFSRSKKLNMKAAFSQKIRQLSPHSQAIETLR